jgi:hypothetical protein
MHPSVFARAAVAGIRTSCIWGALFGVFVLAARASIGFVAVPTLTIVGVWAAFFAGEGLLLVANRRAQRRLAAWNRAYWSRRGRRIPSWCSYSPTFVVAIGALYALVGVSLAAVVADALVQR